MPFFTVFGGNLGQDRPQVAHAAGRSPSRRHLHPDVTRRGRSADGTTVHRKICKKTKHGGGHTYGHDTDPVTKRASPREEVPTKCCLCVFLVFIQVIYVAWSYGPIAAYARRGLYRRRSLSRLFRCPINR